MDKKFVGVVLMNMTDKMKKSTKLAIILILCMLLVLPVVLTACGGDEKPKSDTKIVTDVNGFEVEVPKKVEKILCLGSGTLRMISYAGAQNMLIGVEDMENENKVAISSIIGKPYSYANKDFFKTLPSIGLGGGKNKEPNIEVILALKPDVVFCSYDLENLLKLRKDLLELIPVVYVGFDTNIMSEKTQKNIEKSFDVIGNVLNKKERCDAVVNKINSTFADLNDRTKNILESEKQKTYVGGISYSGAHELSYTYAQYPVMTAINTNTIADIQVGNSAFKSSGSYKIDLEFVIEQNPKYIFVDKANMGLVNAEYNQKKNALDIIDAIQNDNVYGTISYNLYSTNIELALATSYYMGKVLYPQQFADVDVDEKIDELLEFFVGKRMYSEMKTYGYYFGKVKLG